MNDAACISDDDEIGSCASSEPMLLGVALQTLVPHLHELQQRHAQLADRNTELKKTLATLKQQQQQHSTQQHFAQQSGTAQPHSSGFNGGPFVCGSTGYPDLLAAMHAALCSNLPLPPISEPPIEFFGSPFKNTSAALSAALPPQSSAPIHSMNGQTVAVQLPSSCHRKGAAAVPAHGSSKDACTSAAMVDQYQSMAGSNRHATAVKRHLMLKTEAATDDSLYMVAKASRSSLEDQTKGSSPKSTAAKSASFAGLTSNKVSRSGSLNRSGSTGSNQTHPTNAGTWGRDGFSCDRQGSGSLPPWSASRSRSGSLTGSDSGCQTTLNQAAEAGLGGAQFGSAAAGELGQGAFALSANLCKSLSADDRCGVLSHVFNSKMTAASDASMYHGGKPLPAGKSVTFGPQSQSQPSKQPTGYGSSKLQPVPATTHPLAGLSSAPSGHSVPATSLMQIDQHPITRADNAAWQSVQLDLDHNLDDFFCDVLLRDPDGGAGSRSGTYVDQGMESAIAMNVDSTQGTFLGHLATNSNRQLCFSKSSQAAMGVDPGSDAAMAWMSPSANGFDQQFDGFRQLRPSGLTAHDSQRFPHPTHIDVMVNDPLDKERDVVQEALTGCPATYWNEDGKADQELEWAFD